jgi:uncharacterized protein YbaP (TraB family)
LLWTLLLASGLLAVPAHADSEGQPFLYRIAAEPPSYLFGTIHLPDPRVLDLPDVVNEALAHTKILYTEIKLDPETQLEMVRTMGQEGVGLPRLRDRISPELYSRLEVYVDQRGMPMLLFEQQPIWLITVTLPVLDYLKALQTQPPLDLYLAQSATQKGQEIRGLETVEEQLDILRSGSVEDQIQLLEGTLDQLEKAKSEGRDAVQDLIAVYLSGDADRLLAEMKESIDRSDPVAASVYERLINGRSAIMAERIQKVLNKEPGPVYFFAIGAGHLPGDKGVIALLRAGGLKVERIER